MHPVSYQITTYADLNTIALLTAASNCTEQMSDSRAQIFKKFLDSGADVNARNDNGWTVLHFLTMRGFNAGLFEVLKFKPEINSANAAGNTRGQFPF